MMQGQNMRNESKILPSRPACAADEMKVLGEVPELLWASPSSK